jgi:hypothetical protein
MRRQFSTNHSHLSSWTVSFWKFFWIHMHRGTFVTGLFLEV